MIRARPSKTVFDELQLPCRVEITNPDYARWLEELFELLRDEHLGHHHVHLLALIALGEAEIPTEWRA